MSEIIVIEVTKGAEPAEVVLEEHAPVTATFSQGTAGPPGPEGKQGKEGSEGKEGKQGAEGKEGAKGSTGEKGVTGSPGPEGKEGPAGAKGTTGNTGLEGKEGPQGATGSTGATGPEGKEGKQGKEGPEGKGIEEPKWEALEEVSSSLTTESGYHTPECAIDSLGVVHLRGVWEANAELAANAKLFKLPSKCRPSSTARQFLAGGNASLNVKVLTSGVVEALAKVAKGKSIALDGVNFFQKG